MTINQIDKVKASILEKYEAKTSRSKEIFQKAQEFLPGGGTRNIAYYFPYPFFITKGEGVYLEDVDGNRYIDCLNNMTVLLHGHADKDITKAIREQAKEGTAHAAPMEVQYELAKIICERTPSVESLRFCNSGTEATMFAIRAARVYTGKNKIIKTDGGYHGAHDYVQVNVNSDLTSTDFPNVVPEKGVPQSVANDVYVVPYNDITAAEKIMKKHHKKIACMIVEPVMGSGGGIEATKEYLKGLRELTTKYNILLIFDEVITFRLSLGGAQELFDVTPDLTAFGKIIGGGLPIGAFGGRKEILDLFNPMKKGYVQHSGTFSGNAMSMVAGTIALQKYDRQAIEHLDELGDYLRDGLRKIIDELGMKARVGGIQSLTYIHMFEEEPINVQQLSIKTIPFLEFSKYLQVAMAINGIYTVSRGVTALILSTPMDKNIIDQILKKMKQSFEMVLPLYEDASKYQGFAGIVYTMLKGLNKNQDFKDRYVDHDYSLLIVAKDDPWAAKVTIQEGKVDFEQIDNTKEIIQKAKKESDGTITTYKPTFLGLGLGKVNALKAILTRDLKISGIKYILKFTKYFDLLR